MTDVREPPWETHGEVRYPVSAEARELADSLFGEIVAGVYSFGTRLPAERALSERRGLSRTTVRQALGLMESFGVIRRRVGSTTSDRSSRSAPWPSRPMKPISP